MPRPLLVPVINYVEFLSLDRKEREGRGGERRGEAKKGEERNGMQTGNSIQIS